MEAKNPATPKYQRGEDLPEWARRDSSRRRPEANARLLAPEASILFWLRLERRGTVMLYTELACSIDSLTSGLAVQGP